MDKKKKSAKDPADVASELLELAHAVNLPDGFFDGDVEDECQEEAREKAKKINAGLLIDQIEFLLEHGYHPSRLRELIEEADGR